MIEVKDWLGSQINVGDFVLVADRGYSKGLVLNFTQVKIRTTVGLIYPSECIVANDILRATGHEEWMQKELAANADKITGKVEQRKISWRYLVAIVTDAKSNQKFGVVMKLIGNSASMLRDDINKWLEDRGYLKTAHTYFAQPVYKGWSGTTSKYESEFELTYRRWDTANSLQKIKSDGFEALVDTPMPIDDFMLKYPKYNMNELRSAGKI